ncbi:hypothetical protein EGW08_016566, partial [Elysia chlorotica]
RYRKVCVPFGWQISARQAKTISCVLIATSVLFSIPYGLINGTLTRPTPRPGIFGHECSVDDSYVETIWPLTNNALFFFLFLACCSTIVVLYYLVGTKTLRHSRAMGRSAFSCATDGPSSSDGAIVTSSTFTTNMAASDTSNRDSPDATSRIMVEGPLKSIRNRLSKSSKTDNFSLIKNFRGYFTLCANSEGLPVTSNLFDLSRQQPAGNNKALVVNRRYDQNSSNIAKTKNKALKKNGFASTLKGLTRQDSICERPKVNEPGTKRNLNRTSVMLTTISAIFIVSFIPFLTLAFYFNAHPNAYLALSGTSLSLYHLFVRSYFLNCAANAVIYGIYDLTFR